METNHTMVPVLSIKHLSKRFGKMVVFDDFSASFEAGKITVIFGPNGAGKTTLLNILAGVEEADSGTILFYNVIPDSRPCRTRTFGRVIRDPGEINADAGFPIRSGMTSPLLNTSPSIPLLTQGEGGRMSYVFQNYRDSLLPWKTAFDNLAFPLVLQKKKKSEINKRVQDVAKGIGFDLAKYPYELSGGQQQILSFLRAIITKPKLFLVDEPFSALDYENNLLLRERLLRYYDEEHPTVIAVTHDIEEAVHLGHEIVVVSRKPTRAVERIENPLPFPRDAATLSSEVFNQTKTRVLAAFERACSISPQRPHPQSLSLDKEREVAYHPQTRRGGTL